MIIINEKNIFYTKRFLFLFHFPFFILFYDFRVYKLNSFKILRDLKYLF